MHPVVRPRRPSYAVKPERGVADKGNPNVHDVPQAEAPTFSRTEWVRSRVGSGPWRGACSHTSCIDLTIIRGPCARWSRSQMQLDAARVPMRMRPVLLDCGRRGTPWPCSNVSGRCAAPSLSTTRTCGVFTQDRCLLARCGSVACPPGRDRNGELRVSHSLTRLFVSAPAQVSGWSCYA